MILRIVTHGDLDGVASAALCSGAFGVNRVVFSGPVAVQTSSLPITAEDVVCDLPCPAECALWFDHHEGNAEDLRQRGIDPRSVPGRFAPAPSCARVVLDHLAAEGRSVPGHWASLADAVDVVDSFRYDSVEEWRASTPAHRVVDAMKAPFRDGRVRNQFYRNLMGHLRDHPLERVAEMGEVKKFRAVYRAQEEKMFEVLRQDARVCEDASGIILVDLTRHNRRPFVHANLAQVLFPAARAILAVGSAFKGSVKTNDLTFSMALTIRQNLLEETRDVGEIMRSLNIGDGHPGAGAGRVACRSKAEKHRIRDEVLSRILELWKGQEEEP